MELIAFLFLAMCMILGLIAVFFFDVGTLVILVGAVLFAVLTKFSMVTGNTLLVLFLLYLVGEACEYILVVIGAKKLGSSNIALLGAVVGAILGAYWGESSIPEKWRSRVEKGDKISALADEIISFRARNEI